MKKSFLLIAGLIASFICISGICNAVLYPYFTSEKVVSSTDSNLISQSFNPPIALSNIASNEVPVAGTDVVENYLNDVDVKSLVLDDATHYSFYYLDLSDPKNREAQVYNSCSMRSASMIKVFILATAMEKASRGELDLEEHLILDASDKVGGAGIISGYSSGTSFSIKKLLELMITESDNTATNMIIDKVGINYINEYIKINGYNDTILNRKMMDFAAVREGRENYTSVRDLGKFFTKLYDKKCVNQEYDDIMIDFLVGQTDTEGIPAVLENATVAHKTGEPTGLYNDGGIIYNTRDSVLVIMTDDYGYRAEAIDGIHRITRHFIQDKTPHIIDMPIPWNEKKIALTQEYSQLHYGTMQTEIVPEAVVIHWTVSNTWEPVYNYFYSEKMADGTLNVASHFLVDRDGTIYRLTPETRLNRHIIGYNWCAIGVENVGGIDGVEDLTYEQLMANISLVRYLHSKFPTIKHIFGHYQQNIARKSGLYKENVDGYFSIKSDPGSFFMSGLKDNLKDEGLVFYDDE